MSNKASYINLLARPNTNGLIRKIGAETVEAICRTSLYVHKKMPILGTDHYVYNGHLFRYQASMDEDPMHKLCAMAGFSSLSDLKSEGLLKNQTHFFQKTTNGAAVEVVSTWRFGNVPPAGAAAVETFTGANGGEILTNLTTGAIPLRNFGDTGDTMHLTHLYATQTANNAANLLILYDRTWQAAGVNMNVGTLQTNGGGATDRPDRYTSSTTAIGNFASLELNGPNGATPQTLTMGYLDQNGVSRTSNPVTIPAGGGDRQINFTPPLFCVPLLTGHGITKVESLQFNVGSGSAGTYDVFMGHLLSYIPLPVQNVPVHMEGLLQGFNLPYVFNSACLSFIEIPNGTNSAYNGQLSFAAG